MCIFVLITLPAVSGPSTPSQSVKQHARNVVNTYCLLYLSDFLKQEYFLGAIQPLNKAYLC